jgi:ribonuclease inhibitor
MKELVLDGSNWQTRDDVYDAFFAAVRAPEWHGRNFNALRDSIGTGQINDVEVPYRVVIRNFDQVSGEATQMAHDFVDLLRELHQNGVPVEVEVQPSKS